MGIEPFGDDETYFIAPARRGSAGSARATSSVMVSWRMLIEQV